MKRVLAGVVVIGLAMTGANYYYLHQVEKQLDSAASMMRTMGAIWNTAM